ncbi:uncharacterized protein [Clytia hemisphaerica]
MYFFICCGYFFSWLQAPIQAYLRPALWFPGLRAIHQKKERWTVLGDTRSNFENIKNGIQTLKDWSTTTYGDHEMKIQIVDEEKMFIQMHFLTPFMQWLDVVELEIRPGQHSGAEVEAHSFSTGVFPICFPLAFVINVLLFFVPFYDWGQNHARLEKIRTFCKIGTDIEFLSNC